MGENGEKESKHSNKHVKTSELGIIYLSNIYPNSPITVSLNIKEAVLKISARVIGHNILEIGQTSNLLTPGLIEGYNQVEREGWSPPSLMSGHYTAQVSIRLF